MKFSGLQKISLIDYPNKVASVLFTPGCNLRCGFCHNWRIAVDPQPPFLQEATALDLLEARKKYVDAVVVTTGVVVVVVVDVVGVVVGVVVVDVGASA